MFMWKMEGHREHSHRMCVDVHMLMRFFLDGRVGPVRSLIYLRGARYV